MRLHVPRPLLLLVAGLGLASAGCLEWEKETFVFTFQPDKDEINVLLLHEGFQVAGNEENDRTSAEKDLEQVFARSQGFYLGHPMGIIGPLTPDEMKEKDWPEEKKKTYALIRKHLTVRKGTFFLNKEGGLCGSQEVTIREAKKFVEGLNGLISAAVGQAADKALADATKKNKDGIDEESLRLQQKAVKNKHQWIHWEPGRISLTWVGTPKFFATVKHEVVNDLVLRELRRLVNPPVAPGGQPPKPPDPDKVKEELNYKLKQVERLAALISETPWSFDQRRDRGTLSVGLGGGDPVRFFSPYIPTKPGNKAAVLVDRAKKLGLEIKKDATAESVIADFLKKHAPKKK